jgi:asparagine synthase (glutamine-hydrolysing)
VKVERSQSTIKIPELKRELEAQGATFKTTSDTEVILQLYLSQGVEAFKQLNGMFAFCIWDYRSQSYYIVRDQVGMKPLYLYQDQEKLIFSSELEAILCLPSIDMQLDEQGVSDYLTFRYTQAPLTCYKSISRLPSGYYLKINGETLSQFCYSTAQYQDPLIQNTPSTDELKKKVRELVLNAVESQLMGEVPIGVLLSGGVDSSIIAWAIHHLGADLTTYNIGFPNLNEFEFSREVAKAYKLKHIEICTTPTDIINDFDTVLDALDEPIADPACFPLYQLCTELKKSVTVVLSGEGGDELFAGYPQYVRSIEFAELSSEERFDRHLDLSFYFRDAARFLSNKFLTPDYLRNRKYFSEFAGINSALAYDMRTWMPENLMMKADKILMAHSLEGRFPFLDKNLIEFCQKLPSSLKISADLTTKWLLKESFRDILPPIITERPKMGFSVPIDLMLLNMKERVMDSPHQLRTHPISLILDLKEISLAIEKHFSGTQHAPLQIWTIFILLSWIKRH